MRSITRLLVSTACLAAAGGTEGNDLPLSDPKHPLHRPVIAKPEAPQPDAVTLAPAATPTKTEKPAKAKKAATSKKTKAAKAKDGDAPAPRSIVPAKFKARYAEHDGSNGDKIAAAFKSYTTTTNEDGRECMDEDKLAEVAKANGIDLSKYKAMNNGQKRMNVGNRLRGMLKAGQTVNIGGIKFADAKKALVVQPVKAKPAKAAKQEEARAAA